MNISDPNEYLSRTNDLHISTKCDELWAKKPIYLYNSIHWIYITISFSSSSLIDIQYTFLH